MKPLLSSLLLTATAIALPATAQVASPEGLDYQALGEQLLEELGIAPEEAEALGVEGLIDAQFDHVRLGVFRLRIPQSALDDKQDFNEVVDVLQAMIRAQACWLQWLEPDKLSRSEACTDALHHLDTLSGWIDLWNRKRVEDRVEGRPRDLELCFPTKETAREALDVLGSWFDRGGPLGPNHAPLEVPMALIPSRGEFVRFACALGVVDPSLREFYWVEGLQNWTELRWNEMRVAALEFFGGDSPTDYEVGVQMNAKNKNGQAEQLAFLALLSLFETTFGSGVDPSFGAGIANNMLIEIYGEVDTRADGDLRARKSEAWGGFIPGAPSQGGVLPPNRAGSRWRIGEGSDYFLKALTESQKLGFREAGRKGDKHLHFKLLDDEELEAHFVTAPFLGDGARDKPALGEFEGDWLEFRRSFNVAFLHWLRDNTSTSTPLSRERFAVFMIGLADVETLAEFRDLMTVAWEGVPLSAAVPDKRDLEGRFLNWLMKQ